MFLDCIILFCFFIPLFVLVIITSVCLQFLFCVYSSCHSEVLLPYFLQGGLVVINLFSPFIAWKVFLPPSAVADTVAWYSSLGWHLCPFFYNEVHCSRIFWFSVSLQKSVDIPVDFHYTWLVFFLLQILILFV